MNDNVVSILLPVGKFMYDIEFTVNINVGTDNKKVEFKKNRIIRIPAYQRQIRWKKENVSRLVSDIVTGPKFLGNIMLSTKDEVIYDVIDGQQRLTVLYLILSYILRKTNSSSGGLCGYSNSTYMEFSKALEVGFDIENSESIDEILKADILDQNKDFKNIWLQVAKSVDEMTANEINMFLGNIKKCKMNILLDIEKEQDNEEEFLVNYYLDINDKAVPLDSIDILKGYLFKYSYHVMTENWAKNQKMIKGVRMKGVPLSVDNFYFYYFLCTVNKHLDYKLTKLPQDFTLPKKICNNPKGTHVVDAITDFGYYTTMMSDIENMCIYFQDIVDNQEYSKAFKDRYNYTSGEKVDDVTLKNFFWMQKQILLTSDSVPKLLLFKYYLEILKREKASKKDYDLLYSIYVCAVMFSAMEHKKTVEKFMKLALSKDFERDIKKKALEYINSGYEMIKFNRVVKNTQGEINAQSGQYLPKNIFAVQSFFAEKNRVLSVNKEGLFSFSHDVEHNTEHFFCPQSNVLLFSYGTKTVNESGEKQQKKAQIPIPNNLKKILSVPANYLILEKNVNRSVRNLWIVEKVEMISAQKDKAFSNSIVREFFEKIEGIFFKTDILKELEKIEEEKEAIKIIKKFYKEDFDVLFSSYLDEINSL